MGLPSVTVIIPNYNHGEHLPACVASVLNQSVPPSEVIIIDDGSTDDSYRVMEELARRHPIIQIYKNEKNSGVNFTLNRGIDLARSDYFLPQAADDELMPGFFERALTLLAQYPQAAFCGGICEFADPGRGLTYYYGLNVADKPRYFTPDEMIAQSRQGRLLIFTAAMVLRRQAVLEVGKYHLEMKWSSDWFMAWVAGFRHGVCFVPEIQGRFKKSTTSYSGKTRRDTRKLIEVGCAVLDYLNRPEYQDAAERIKQSTSLANYGKEVLWAIIRHRKYRHFMTPAYLKRALWVSLKAEMKETMPDSLVRWAMKMVGYASPPKPSTPSP